MDKIVVGMSGGVDSSVAAALLQEQGWDVIGVFMKNWDDIVPQPTYRTQEVMNGCSWERDLADARAVCDRLGIPLKVYYFVKEYHDLVFNIFIAELKKGHTPNPDILCNQEIKFRLFMERACAEEGVRAIATGHYARIRNGVLCRPKDLNKDQTYFLFRIPRERFAKIYFPLADFMKDEVRAKAEKLGFPNADKKDSTGICFIGEIKYNDFVREYIPRNPGNIETAAGEVIGTHDGLQFYTLGQRKGVNIGGCGPYYVLRKDQERNVLVVTNDNNDVGLFASECLVEDLHWLMDVELPDQASVHVRYRQPAQSARIEWATQGSSVRVLFDTPQRAVTSGQSAVMYDGDCVLGGGTILSYN